MKGPTAKQIFDRAQLPNDVLIRIWNLADTEQRGKLSITEFVIAMHLLASFKSGAMHALPQNLPAGLYEAAARRGAPPPRPQSANRPAPDMQGPSAIPRQFSGAGGPRVSSPLARQAYNAPAAQPQPNSSTSDWAIPPHEKAQYDGQFAKLDASNQGYISGDQAVGFFSNSQLPEDDLAQIWDLADITSSGQLNRDEFAVAVHLIREQLSKKGPLPTTLPPNMVPPSMRQQKPVQQPHVPPSNPPRAKSAADDLFGLDAFAAPAPPQVPQSTGGSSTFTAPTNQPASSPPSQSQQSQQSTVFKPFVPSSSFGQSIATQATGSTTATSSAQQPRGFQPDNDDLLGDTDPEVSKRLTSETTELANLSNQVGSLTNQMKDVRSKRGSTEQDLSQVDAQKSEFESRLAQLRSAYEQEAREVKSLEERLAAARAATQKAQQDCTMVQHTYQGLQEQRQQVLAALESDQRENANLKERMRQVNNEINQIKLQIDKMRSDARQHKGLVAINKKQLSTNEAEREKLKGELDAATAEYTEASRELEESKRSLGHIPPISSPPPPAVSSPTPSTTSMNPFFRRNTATSIDRGATQSTYAAQPTGTPNQPAFDSFFGSSLPTTSPFPSQTEAPPATFQQPRENSQAERSPGPGSSESGANTSGLSESDLPPPPPQSRQITSSLLPLKDSTPRAASPSSSVGVAPPASRYGENSGYATPATDADPNSSQSQNGPKLEVSPLAQADSTGSIESGPSSLQNPPQPHPEPLKTFAPEQHSVPQDQPSAPQQIPGAFPGDQTPISTPGVGASDASQPPIPNDDPFTTGDQSAKGSLSAKDDFDSAFASFEDKGKAPDTSKAFETPTKTSREEFPPIREYADDESDSDSERGFDDDFTATSPPRPLSQQPAQSGSQSAAANIQPPSSISRSASNTSQLPTPNAQKSPPTYDETVSPVGKDDARRESNQFPAEYTGLLPSRSDPTSPPNSSSPAVQIPPSEDTGTSLFGAPGDNIQQPGSESAAIETAPPPSKSAFDDFEFGDLSEAQTTDEKGDDDFPTDREGVDEFNPTFDSPAPSKTTTFNEGSAFHDFEPNDPGPAQASSAAGGVLSQQAGPTNQDWDAMFANMDGSNGQANSGRISNGTAKGEVAGFGGASSSAGGLAPAKPPLARALSTGTEHDDPILKRLTSMGYPRDVSLSALEKFDYNLDKVRSPSFWSFFKTLGSFGRDELIGLQAADYLTSKG